MCLLSLLIGALIGLVTYHPPNQSLHPIAPRDTSFGPASLSLDVIMKPKRINAVLITSPDGAKLFEFYRDLVGVPLEEEHHGPELHWGCDLDGVHFAIHQDSKQQSPISTIAISFEVDDVEKTISTLRSKGIGIEMPPTDMPFGKLASIRDPDGNLIYFHKYP